MGSLVERTRESVKGIDGLEPIGGEHLIDTDTADVPSSKLEIGRPEEIENHDPIANNVD